MKREKKFRIWLKPEHWNESENKGLMTNGRKDFNDMWWINLDEPFNDKCSLDGEFEEGVQVEVLEYIGIKDKNGIEIYEGDYLVDRYPIDDENLDAGYHESLLPVVWCDVKLQWCVDASFAKDGSYLVSVTEYFGEHLEVKGNIYENPQL